MGIKVDAFTEKRDHTIFQILRLSGVFTNLVAGGRRVAGGNKVREDLGGEANLQYVEHPNRAQRSQCLTLRFRGRRLLRKAG